MTIWINLPSGFSQGQEALARGDYRQAVKDLSVAISLNPNCDAFLMRADAHFLAGNISAAISDIDRVEQLCWRASDGHDWANEIAQARNRYLAASSPDQSPRAEQTISVVLPTSMNNPDLILERLSNRPEFSTDGETLFRKGGMAVYDLAIYDRNPDLAELIIELGEKPPLSAHLKRLVSDHSLCLHIDGPNAATNEAGGSQMTVAIDLLLSLEPLMQSLDAPVAFMSNSYRVHTREEIQEFGENLSPQTMIHAYTRLHHSESELYVMGMHCLGYADAQIPVGLLSHADSLDLLLEWLVAQVKSEVVMPGQSYFTDTKGLRFALELRPCHRFDDDSDARSNPNGLWVFTRKLH